MENYSTFSGCHRLLLCLNCQQYSFIGTTELQRRLAATHCKGHASSAGTAWQSLRTGHGHLLGRSVFRASQGGVEREREQEWERGRQCTHMERDNGTQIWTQKHKRQPKMWTGHMPRRKDAQKHVAPTTAPCNLVWPGTISRPRSTAEVAPAST